VKLNNKGISIIEIIVSISLISVVMLFMYRMLDDITFEKDNDFIASLNQEQRIEIIDVLQTSLMQEASKNPITVTGSSMTGSSELIIYTNDGLRTIKVDNADDVITFDKENTSLNPDNKWKIKNASITGITCKSNCPITGCVSGKEVIKLCTIKVFTNNINNKIYSEGAIIDIDNNNTLDDIEFSFRYTQP